MIARIASIAGLVVLAAGSALAGYAIVEHRNPVSAITQIFIPNPQEVFGKPNLLVLVEGLDYDYTAKDEEYSTNARSDVIWAVNLDFSNKRIYELSIPRDMMATMPNGAKGRSIRRNRTAASKKPRASSRSGWAFPDSTAT